MAPQGDDCYSALLKCPGYNLSQIQHLHFFARLQIFDAVFKHCHAIWTAYANRPRVFLQGFLDPLVVDTLAGAFLHPHVSTAGAAAKRPVQAAFHLSGCMADRPGQDFAGSLIDSVVASQVAGIMKQHFAQFSRSVQFQPLLFYQSADKLGMMDDFPIRTVLMVVILQGMIAVGALGANFFYPTILEYLNIVFNDAIKNIFIPQTPQTVSTAEFILTQDAPRNASSIQNMGYGQADLSVPSVKSAGAADIK